MHRLTVGQFGSIKIGICLLRIVILCRCRRVAAFVASFWEDVFEEAVVLLLLEAFCEFNCCSN